MIRDRDLIVFLLLAVLWGFSIGVSIGALAEKHIIRENYLAIDKWCVETQKFGDATYCLTLYFFDTIK